MHLFVEQAELLGLAEEGRWGWGWGTAHSLRGPSGDISPKTNVSEV